MIPRSFTALAALLLSACAGQGQDGRGYPSLAKRPVEAPTRETPADAIPPAPRPGDYASLDRQLTALTDQARQGGIAFDTLYAEVAGHIRVSASAEVSSEQWVAAQVELGRLEQARYGSVYALASLDTLHAEQMKEVAEGAAAGVERIEAARAQALAIVDSQNDRVDALRAALKQP